MITDSQGHTGELVFLDDGATFNSWLTKEYQDSNGNPVVLTKGQQIKVFDGIDPELFSADCKFYDDDNNLPSVCKPAAGGILIEGKVLSLRDTFVHVVDDRDPDPNKHQYSTFYPLSDGFELITP